ncbi:MAG: hypothetical protein IT564_02945 [Rhodospirillales bacterium]|nr:hypothetical protein [Rhodospirillales bacterium]
MPDQPEPGDLARALLPDMGRMTWDRHGEMAMANIRRNAGLAGRGRSLADLRGAALGEGTSAVVVAAGPSARRFDPVGALKARGYPGAVIATESAIARCLKAGLVPHLVVSVDPHPERIVRWFGDPELSEQRSAGDDYYRRQDMDPAFADELSHNRELLALLARHGKSMKIALATSASEAVVRRASEIGMEIYWWNPMLDDPDQPGSRTREAWKLNRLPCVNAGGNVGSACWMMAHAVLGKKHVALTGMDFAYYDGTPYSATQYYREALALVGEQSLARLYPRFLNPHTGTWFFTDPAYFWYREAFLEMVRDADCVTYNCTGGGILFGDGITHTALEDFLDRHG